LPDDEKERLIVYRKRKRERGITPGLILFCRREKRKEKGYTLSIDVLFPRQREVICLLYYNCLSEAGK